MNSRSTAERRGRWVNRCASVIWFSTFFRWVSMDTSCWSWGWAAGWLSPLHVTTSSIGRLTESSSSALLSILDHRLWVEEQGEEREIKRRREVIHGSTVWFYRWGFVLELSYLSTLKQQNSREAEPASSSAQNRDDVFALFTAGLHTVSVSHPHYCELWGQQPAKNRLTNSWNVIGA